MERTDDPDREIRAMLYRYCETFDDGDFAAFATLFEHGRWFMVREPGADPVRTWIEDNVVLYDGRPLTRHEILNPIVEFGADADRASFRCRLTIWQHLPARPARLMTHARFSGTARRLGGHWRWEDHRAVVEYVGDLSGHLRGDP